MTDDCRKTELNDGPDKKKRGKSRFIDLAPRLAPAPKEGGVAEQRRSPSTGRFLGDVMSREEFRAYMPRRSQVSESEINEKLKAVVSRRGADGKFAEVGTNHRTVIKGSEKSIRKAARKWAKGDHRIEYHRDDSFYKPPHKTEVVREEEEIQMDEAHKKGHWVTGYTSGGAGSGDHEEKSYFSTAKNHSRALSGVMKKLAKKNSREYGASMEYANRPSTLDMMAHKGSRLTREEQELQELSKKTLGSYVRGASGSIGANNFRAGKNYGKELATKKRTKADQENSRMHNRIADRRRQGIDRALKRLVRESQEIEEGRGRPRKDGSQAATEDPGFSHSLMKAVSLRGNHPVRFQDGSSVKVRPEHAHRALSAIAALRTSGQKMALVNHIMQSHAHFQDALKEDIVGIVEDAYPATAEELRETGADFTFHGRRDDPKVKEKIALAKVLGKARDAFHGTKTQVRVRARLGRNNPNAHLYRSKGGSLRAQTVHAKHGSYHDVYMNDMSPHGYQMGRAFKKKD